MPQRVLKHSNIYIFTQDRLQNESYLYACNCDNTCSPWTTTNEWRKHGSVNGLLLFSTVCLDTLDHRTEGVNVFLFNIFARTWHTLPQARIQKYMSAFVYHAGSLYSVGGYARGSFTFLPSVYLSASCEQLNLASGKWEAAPESWRLPCPRAGHGACVQDGYLYIAGGRVVAAGGSSVVRYRDTLDFERMHLASGKWMQLNPLPESPHLDAHCCVELHPVLKGKLCYITRGLGVQLYDPLSGAWTRLAEGNNSLTTTTVPDSCSPLQGFSHVPSCCLSTCAHKSVLTAVSDEIVYIYTTGVLRTLPLTTFDLPRALKLPRPPFGLNDDDIGHVRFIAVANLERQNKPRLDKDGTIAEPYCTCRHQRDWFHTHMEQSPFPIESERRIWRVWCSGGKDH